MKKYFAIIAAAGNGTRFCNSNNKMLVPLLGRPLLSYTLDKFEESEKIDEIILVVRPQDQKKIKQEIINKNFYSKVKLIIAGGSTRQESVYNGLMAIKEDEGIVLIHDGARPFLKEGMIVELIDMIGNFVGVIPAVPIVETVKKVILSNMMSDRTVDRNEFWTVQTPQAFQLNQIRDCYKKAIKDNILFTDDSSLFEYYGGKIAIIRGSDENIKITTKVDLMLAEALIKKCYF